MTGQSLMTWLVTVAARITLALAHAMQDVQVEKYAAQPAAVPPSASVKVIPAASVATTMPICQSCKEQREKKGLDPLEKVELPVAITDASNFKKPAVPTYVCNHCDGDVLVASALRSLEKRDN